MYMAKHLPDWPVQKTMTRATHTGSWLCRLLRPGEPLDAQAVLTTEGYLVVADEALPLVKHLASTTPGRSSGPRRTQAGAAG